jgi:PPOX class probable F420-dependent enzyme
MSELPAIEASDLRLSEDDLAFLESERVARLGTVDSRARPHVVPVCFAQVGGTLYVPVDAKPKRGNPRDLARLRNLRAHPEATLLVDHYDEDWNQLRWLMVRSLARILDDGNERDASLAALERRYPQYAAMHLASLGLPVIALNPVSIARWSAG